MRKILIFIGISLVCSLPAQDLSSVREFKQLWKYDEATALLTQMMAEQGRQQALLEELADCHYQSGNVPGALEIYTQLSELQPDNILYKLRRMGLLYRGKQYDAVIGIGRDILQRDSITQVISLVGDAFNQQERRDSAELYYRQALSRRPHNEAVLNKLCNILLAQEKTEEVLVLTDTFLSEEPDNVTILPIRGLARFSQKQYRQAEADFMHANRLGEDGYSVHFYLARCAQETGLLGDAEKEFIKAWQRDSSDVGVAMSIGKLQADYRRSGWEQWYDKALSMLLPDQKTLALTASAYQNYALSAYKNGRFDHTIELYKSMLEYDPKHYSAYYMIAQCYEYKKDYKNALSWFKKAQNAFAEGSRGREIADAGAERMTQELFMQQ